MSRVDLKQLAEKLNLSISTVSRALNDSYEIAEETKARVRAKAQQLGYEPNPYASGLRSKKSKTIGLIIPEVANNFFSLAIDGIEEIAQANNYHVLIYLSHESYGRESRMVHHLAGGRVDGILLSVASETRSFEHLGKLLERRIPLVLFDRVSDEIETARVTTDDYASGYRATQHLLAAGCRRIMYLLVSDTLSIGQKRMQGYVDALRDAGIGYEAALVVPGGPDREANTALIKQHLQADERIDGVFASVESLAISTYQACQELNRPIPAAIKVVSFSNLATASLLSPALTTITQPAYTMGREAAKILFRAILRNKPVLPTQSLELRSELIVRDSTRVGPN